MMELIFKGGLSHGDRKEWRGGETAVESRAEDGGSWTGKEEIFLWRREGDTGDEDRSGSKKGR